MDRVETLLRQMTLEEKLAMTAGSGRWHSTGVPRLGVPGFKMTDGPNGARGSLEGERRTALCFPCGAALAATWNPDLIEAVGVELAHEVRSKGAQVLLGPTINLHRTPLGGRNFECYSEDPYLTARIASALVTGLQKTGVGACLKHFACNDSEYERRTISSEVDERTLRELYLRPFEWTLRSAEPWLVMSAYNRINGVYASEHEALLGQILKGEWQFEGAVVSDWGAAMEGVRAARAGLDLEMPGPGRHMGLRLRAAVESGEIDEKTLDDKVRRLLRVVIRSGRIDQPEEAAERSEERPEARRLARRAAAEGMVLLCNDGLLPLLPDSLRRLAVIGPHAEHGQIQGGGSAFVVPHRQSHPLEALRARLEPGCEVVHAPGCRIPRFVTAIPPESLRSEDGRAGLDVAYWNGETFEGPPASRAHTTQGQAFFGRTPPPGVEARSFVVRFSGTFTPQASGEYVFGVSATGRSRLFLDGVEQIDNWTAPSFTHDIFGPGQSRERRQSVHIEAGRGYALRVDYERPASASLCTVRFGALPPEPGDLESQAVEAARQADAAVLLVGTDRDWETEGRDRESLALPDPQNALIERVLAAQPRTVVVVNAGSPVALPWLERSAAVLFTWFPGQELGEALADVLLGDVDPSGRLPVTFPVRLEDTPAFTSYPGESGRVAYGENLFMGYRWYDRRDIAPRLPFGHGHSYTQFRFGPLEAPARHRIGEPLELSLEVTNVGTRPGQEVVQLYVRDRASTVSRPDRELRSFAKLALGPGETGRVRLWLDADAFAHWDVAAHAWRTTPGEYELLAGASSRDIRARATLELHA